MLLKLLLCCKDACQISTAFEILRFVLTFIYSSLLTGGNTSIMYNFCSLSEHSPGNN